MVFHVVFEKAESDAFPVFIKTCLNLCNLTTEKAPKSLNKKILLYFCALKI